MQFFTIVFMTLWFFVVVLNFILFDKLIRIQFKFNKKFWVKDGNPLGFLFILPDASIFFGRNYTQQGITELLFLNSNLSK